MDENRDFAAALDAVITDAELRREIDRAPAETLARLGLDVTALQPAEAKPVMVAPPYVPVGPATKPAMVAPPYVPVGPATKPAMVAPPYVPVGPRTTK
jgi:hypothetical protein